MVRNADNMLRLIVAALAGGAIAFVGILIYRNLVSRADSEVVDLSSPATTIGETVTIQVGRTNHGKKMNRSPAPVSPPSRALVSTEDLVMQINAESDPGLKAGLVDALSKREGLSRLDWLFEVVGDDKRARLAVAYAFLDTNYDRRQAESVLAHAKNAGERNTWGSVYALFFPVSDYETAIAFAEENLTGDEISNSVREIYGRVIDRDPDTGIDLAMRLSKGNLRESLIAIISHKKAVNDPSQAVDWVERLDDPVERIAALKQLSGVWVKKDSESAIDYGKKIPSSSERVAFNMVVVEHLAEKDPQGSVQLVAEFNIPPEAKNKMFHMVFSRWAQHDPQMAAEAIMAGSFEDSTKIRLQRNVIGYWASMDPKKALAWVEKMPESKERMLSVARVARAWISIDSIEASVWIRGLDKSEVRDSAIERLIQTQTAYSPTEALKWALEISDGRKRMRQSSMVLKKVKSPESRDEILKFIEKADLPEKQEGELLRVLYEES